MQVFRDPHAANLSPAHVEIKCQVKVIDFVISDQADIFSISIRIFFTMSMCRILAPMPDIRMVLKVAYVAYGRL